MAANRYESIARRWTPASGTRPPVWPFALAIFGLTLLGVAGMTHPLWAPAGLELRGVRSRLVWEEGRKVLLIEGEIANPRRASASVAPIRLSVRDRQGLDLYAWTIGAPRAVLPAGDRTSFRARLPNPPEEGVETLARFEPGTAPVTIAGPTERRASAALRPQRLASAAGFHAAARDDIPNLRKMP